MLDHKYRNLIEHILSLLSISSVTGDLNGIRKCQELLKDLANTMGFTSSLHGKGQVLVITPRKMTGVPKLGLVVHIDTVPLDAVNWHYNPLGEISDDRIYGRGVIDDKGPTIIALHALEAVKDDVSNSWQLIIGSSEEGSWTDMEDFLSENPVLPEFLVTLDGDGIQNGCRGYTDVSLVFHRETTTNMLTNFYVPNGSNNTLPETAIAIINGKAVSGHGKASHSSIPEEGHSAITNLAVFIKNTYPSSAYLEFKKMFDFLCILDQSSDGNAIGLLDDSEIGTSVSVTNVHMKNDEIFVNLNIRFSPSLQAEEIQAAIHKLSTRYQCIAEFGQIILPSYVDKNQPEFLSMKEAYAQVVGRIADVTFAKGLGYNAALPNCAIFGPRFDPQDEEDADFCHMPDESRKIDDIIKFYEMLKIFLLKTL